MNFIPCSSDGLKALCRLTGKWGMLISSVDDAYHIRQAAPYLSSEQAERLWCDSAAFLLLDTEAELQAAYWQTVGDDGPTKANPYAGHGSVYACTCSPEGQLLNENT